MPALIPFDIACPSREIAQQAESYAENLHRSLEHEIATLEGATQFLETTYPTQAMLSVTRDIFDRLSHGNHSSAPSVYRFNSPFGGGKTHTLITLAAMSKHPQAAASSSAFQNIEIPPNTRLLTFSGDESNPISGQNLPDTPLTVRSITGMLAYQIGGAGLLARYRREDEALASAGADAYREMLGDTPTLILIDELVDYVAKSATAQSDNTGSTQNNAGNIQSLLFDLIQAVASSPKAVLVITAPDPAIDAFREAANIVSTIMAQIDRIVARSVTDITPTAPNDLAPILRRRLFQGCDETARQQTTDAYRDLYALHHPTQVANFAEQVYESYPFHPLLLELINTRLAENPTFQRVRGTLRLLAALIEENSGKDIPLLHPHHIDPAAEYFTSELNARLQQGAFYCRDTDRHNRHKCHRRRQQPQPHAQTSRHNNLAWQSRAYRAKGAV